LSRQDKKIPCNPVARWKIADLGCYSCHFVGWFILPEGNN